MRPPTARDCQLLAAAAVVAAAALCCPPCNARLVAPPFPAGTTCADLADSLSCEAFRTESWAAGADKLGLRCSAAANSASLPASISNCCSCEPTFELAPPVPPPQDIQLSVSLLGPAVGTVRQTNFTFRVGVWLWGRALPGLLAESISLVNVMPHGLAVTGVDDPQHACLFDETAVRCTWRNVTVNSKMTLAVTAQGVFAGDSWTSCSEVSTPDPMNDLDPSNNRVCIPVSVKGACCLRTATTAQCTDALPRDCRSPGAAEFTTQLSAQTSCAGASEGLCAVPQAAKLGACCLKRNVCVMAMSRSACIRANRGMLWTKDSPACDSRCFW